MGDLVFGFVLMLPLWIGLALEFWEIKKGAVMIWTPEYEEHLNALRRRGLLEKEASGE